MKFIIISLLLSLFPWNTYSVEESPLPEKAHGIVKDMEMQIVIIKKKSIALLEKEMKEMTKTGNLDGALAIRAKIELLKLETADQTGAKFPPTWIGQYDNANSGYWGEIMDKGEARHSAGWGGKWIIQDGKLYVEWTGTSYSDILDPPDKDGIVKGTNNRGGIWLMKKVKR